MAKPSQRFEIRDLVTWDLEQDNEADRSKVEDYENRYGAGAFGIELISELSPDAAQLQGHPQTLELIIDHDLGTTATFSGKFLKVVR